MEETYQGYFQHDGRFVADIPTVKMPAMRRVIVKVLADDYVTPAKTSSQKQKDALGRLYAGLAVIDNEPLDDEFDAIMSQRFNIGRELDL